MPTPIDLFLKREVVGDEARQLGASQEWNWRTCRFHGFQDRDVYLRRVRNELILRAGVDPTRLALAKRDGLADPQEEKRRQCLLLSLQSVLQSRRLKLKILREQLYGVKEYEELPENRYRPIHILQAEANESTRHLNKTWFDPYGRAAFSCLSIADSLRSDFNLTKDESPEKIFGISLNPANHVYPAGILQKILWAAKPNSNDSVFFGSYTEKRRDRVSTSHPLNTAEVDDAAKLLASRSVAKSYFPELKPTTEPGRVWVRKNSQRILRCN